MLPAHRNRAAWTALFFLASAAAAQGGAFTFSTGTPDGLLGAASSISGQVQTGDDFTLNGTTTLNSATFTGLFTGISPLVGAVGVDIFRVFPLDSTNPPSGTVPTRVNSPSDVVFDSRVAGVDMTFLTSGLGPFSTGNSVLNGINPSPNQTTGGQGSVRGQEVQFTVTFTTPLTLATGHYYFSPQVDVTGGDFYWLSSANGGGLDLQAEIRNPSISPNWLRIGTDIVGGAVPPKYNMAFSLNGTTSDVPGPASWLLIGTGLAVLPLRRRFGQRA